MTLTQIRDRILDRVGRTGDTTLNDSVKYALESVQDEILSDILFAELVTLDTTSINLIAETPTYNLPSDFGRMLQIWSDSTMDSELVRLTPQEYKTYQGDVFSDNSTDPRFYDIVDASTTGTSYVKKIRFFPYPSSFTNGVIASYAQLSGVPGTFADYNTTVSGTVLITDAAHGMKTGMIVTIAATTNYNGVFTVTVVDANNFYISATYVAEAGGGTWTANGTAVTDVDHGLATDDSITISGTTNYNGAYSVIYIDDDTFYIAKTYAVETPTYASVWAINHYVPMAYIRKPAYLSADSDHNILTDIYPSLYVEGGVYYLYRDLIYRDQPEKIAFRRSEFEKVKKQIEKMTAQPDKIHAVLPKRILPSGQSSLNVQTSGYTS